MRHLPACLRFGGATVLRLPALDRIHSPRATGLIEQAEQHSCVWGAIVAPDQGAPEAILQHSRPRRRRIAYEAVGTEPLFDQRRRPVYRRREQGADRVSLEA